MAPPPPPEGRARAIAPAWHTAALVTLLLVSTWFTSRRAAGLVAGAVHASRITRYSTSIGFEWLLLALVLLGVHRRRAFLGSALFNRAHSWGRMAAIGAAVYVTGFAAIVLTGIALSFTPFLHQRNQAVINGLAPHTALELLMWFGLSLTAGICEELIFRGYLLQQLESWTGRPMLSVMLGALVFGAVHLYEGTAAVLPLAVLAVVYGVVVRRLKGDLRAVIVAHTLQDFVVALLLMARPYLQHLATQR